MKKIKFHIKRSHAPYPAQCWWRITGSSGRIMSASELMGMKNARKSIKRVITAIKSGQYVIVEDPSPTKVREAAFKKNNKKS